MHVCHLPVCAMHRDSFKEPSFAGSAYVFVFEKSNLDRLSNSRTFPGNHAKHRFWRKMCEHGAKQSKIVFFDFLLVHANREKPDCRLVKVEFNPINVEINTGCRNPSWKHRFLFLFAFPQETVQMCSESSLSKQPHN